MILIFIGLVIMFVALIYIIKKGKYNDFTGFVCPILVFLNGISIVAFAITSFDYLGAYYKAEIINREYGTNYTQEEVFFASDVINTVRELNRKRIEAKININGGEWK